MTKEDYGKYSEHMVLCVLSSIWFMSVYNGLIRMFTARETLQLATRINWCEDASV